jgi:hypothetical protein
MTAATTEGMGGRGQNSPYAPITAAAVELCTVMPDDRTSAPAVARNTRDGSRGTGDRRREGRPSTIRCMALLHRAELHPTKLELLAAWLPGRRWYQGKANADVVRVASFRFDDPAGSVGIETMLVRAGSGPTLQVPLTYRDAPLHGGDGWLVGTADHSVLGQRWVYDGCGDAVYAAALASAIFTGGGQAEEYFDVDGRLERREPSMIVTGSGAQDADVATIDVIHRVLDDDPTLIVTDSVELAVVRRIDDSNELPGAASIRATLTGTWNGQPTPLPLAYASVR